MTPTDLAGLCERLRASTALMATTASVRMDVWQDHSTATLEAAAAIESLVALVNAYDVLRAAWTDRQATALHGDRAQYEFCCRRFDDAFDRADAARTALQGASDDR